MSCGQVSTTLRAAVAIAFSCMAFSSMSHAQVPCPPPTLSVDGGSTVQTQCSASEILASKYPGDVGISADPDVIWAENFEHSSVSAVTSRYSDFSNPAGMSFSTDKPSKSNGTKSLRLTSSGSSSSTRATHLFKNLATSSSSGYDELYVRYYIKYQGGPPWAHSGMWVGGYNPAINWPNPQAGLKPTGSDRFSVGFEQAEHGNDIKLDFYNYWMNMRSWMDSPSGNQAYYGNSVLHDPSARARADAWLCVELHVKLNSDPASSAGGQLAVWIDDQLKRRYTNTSPQGYWVRDKFCPSDSVDKECTDFRTSNMPLVPLDLQFRRTNDLKINYVWLQNYITDPGSGSLWFDDVVVARRRIGCIR